MMRHVGGKWLVLIMEDDAMDCAMLLCSEGVNLYLSSLIAPTPSNPVL